MRLILTLALTLFAASLAAGLAFGQAAVDRFEKKAKAPLTAAPAEPPATDPAAADSGAAAGTPYLGVEADETTVTARGALVAKVKKGAPAELGGLRDGDVITAVDGKPVRNWDDVDAAMKAAKVGTKLLMTVQRGGLQETKTVTLGRKEDFVMENPGEPPLSEAPPAETLPLPATPRTPALAPPAAPPPALTPPADASAADPPADPFPRPTRDPDLDLPPPPMPPAGIVPAEPAPPESPLADPLLPPAPGGGRATLGISVVPLTPETRGQYEVRATARQGAVIHSVKAGSPADLAGLPIGGVIVSIDGQLVRTPDDLADAVSAGRPGQEVELRYMLEGDRVVTKNVRLAPAAASAIVPAPRPGAGGGSLARRFEDMVGPSSASPRATRGSSGDAEVLSQIRDELRTLSEKVDSLEIRLRALEGAGAAPPRAE